MDMVNDRKTTAANAPEEIRRAKTLHVKMLNKRRQNPHLGKDDMDDDSSVDSAEEYGDIHPRVDDYPNNPSAVPVDRQRSSIPPPAGIVTQKFPAPFRNENSNEHIEPTTNPLMVQMAKVMDQHHQQYVIPFQQQLLDQLQLIQRQNQEILELLNQKGTTQVGNSKKRPREGDDAEVL